MSWKDSYEVNSIQTTEVLAYLPRELHLLQLDHLLCVGWWELTS